MTSFTKLPSKPKPGESNALTSNNVYKILRGLDMGKHNREGKTE